MVIACVLHISDLHAPFIHRHAIGFLKWLRKKFHADRIVCAGDEVDEHALSFHEHDPDGFSAGMEHAEAVYALKEVYKIFPNVSVCISNHTARPFRVAMKAGLPKAFIRDYRDFMQAPIGWEWKHSWTVDSVDYLHGMGVSGMNGAITLARARRRSTAIGHIHTFGGVKFDAGPHDTIFGLNSGCLFDENSYAARYALDFKHRPTIGSSIIIDGKLPMFVSMDVYLADLKKRR